MTLADYENGNEHARVRQMFLLLSPRDKFSGMGGLEPLGLYTTVEYAAANAYGIGTNRTNAGTAVAHVDINMLPDPLLGRENRHYYPSIFVHGARVVGTYVDEAQRDRFGVIPERPILPWDAVKITKFNELNAHFGDRYQERVRLSEHEEYKSYVDKYNLRDPREYDQTAYAVMIVNPSTQFAPAIADIVAVFYGEENSLTEAIERIKRFRYDNPTAPRMVVAPLPVNSPVENFNHAMFAAKSNPESMPYHDAERTDGMDIREYETMLSEVGRIHNTRYIEQHKLSA